MPDLDTYDRGARLAPAYLVFSPAVVFVVVLSLGTPDWWSKLGGVLVALGAPMLVVQWGRSGGRRKQVQLWQKWGGPPTTRLLRFADGGNSVVVAQRHEAVERATGASLPTREQEAADPADADAHYDAAVTTLRALTENEPLVLKENVAYGFRRNLWARRSYGIAVALAVLAISLGLLVADAAGADLGSAAAAGVAAAIAAVALVVWLAIVNEDWVGEAAEAYAERLMQTATRLPPRASD
jgi:hypothetical protein